MIGIRVSGGKRISVTSNTLIDGSIEIADTTGANVSGNVLKPSSVSPEIIDWLRTHVDADQRKLLTEKVRSGKENEAKESLLSKGADVASIAAMIFALKELF